MIGRRWFLRYIYPKHPGIYLCRSYTTGDTKLTWWRCYDGANWRAGIVAVNPQGQNVNPAPSFESQSKNPVVAEYVSFEWCKVPQ